VASLSLSAAVALAGETPLKQKMEWPVMAVDNAHEHLLVGGLSSEGIYVLSYSGKRIAKIKNVGEVYDMAISGNTLFVVDGKLGVVEVNLTTLQVNPTPLISWHVQPWAIAVTGDTLWAAVAGEVRARRQRSSPQWYELASLNLTTHAYAVFPQIYSKPSLVTSPADPETLFLGTEGISIGEIDRFSVSSGTPVLTASISGESRQYLSDLAVTPDGKRLIVDAVYPDSFEELSAATLEPGGFHYAAEGSPCDEAVSGPQADLLATDIEDGGTPDIRVYSVGDAEPIFEAIDPDSKLDCDHGLALSANGRWLFAVSFTGETNHDAVLNTYELQ
jgi:hypothetical protein